MHFLKILYNHPVVNLKRFQEKLEKITDFGHISKVQIGAMDGTHIHAVITPKENEVLYIGRKGMPRKFDGNM